MNSQAETQAGLAKEDWFNRQAVVVFEGTTCRLGGPEKHRQLRSWCYWLPTCISW
ncbi:hypothetical protein ABGV42_28045 [Paenibacillus pabuli]|uniref:hypothetical protein n=1 Tax=Paenibacillus pabuli TaxID=1472 RepID=UPI003242F2B9